MATQDRKKSTPLTDVEELTIALGESDTDAIELFCFRPYGINMPDGWDAADLIVLASHDGVTFNPLYDMDGSLVRITVDADRFVGLYYGYLAGFTHMKLRSVDVGGDTPENQTADRALQLVLKNLPGG